MNQLDRSVKKATHVLWTTKVIGPKVNPLPMKCGSNAKCKAHLGGCPYRKA